MYTVFLAGGIASGKSTVAAELSRLGAVRIDLDALSRTVLAPGQPCLRDVCEVFGGDLVSPQTGELDRHLLAKRAFSSAEQTARLEAIEHPYITTELRRLLAQAADAGAVVCVVEVQLLDRVEALVPLADEVLVVDSPRELRRERAVARGMEAADFDARTALQPSDAYLRSHSDTLIPNRGDEQELLATVDAWWSRRASSGWKREGAR